MPVLRDVEVHGDHVPVNVFDLECESIFVIVVADRYPPRANVLNASDYSAPSFSVAC
jgi:hypothetical protein